MTKRFKRYPKYKDSGVEWLGEVPAHWGAAPLFTLARERNTSNKQGVESNVLSLSYGRIVRRDISDNFGLLPESFDTYQIVEAGDIVLRLTDLQNDKRSLRVGLVSERGIITSAYVALGVCALLEAKFAFYLLHAYDITKVFYALGGGVRQTMKFEDLKRLPLIIPLESEQRRIIAFLDRETARIDTLVAKKERLIELLEEERSALISRAVTRGLDPTVPMKDSGIEPLGEIPVYWEVRQLRRLIREGTSITYGIVQAGPDVPGGVPYIRTSDMAGDFLPESGYQRTSPEIDAAYKRSRVVAGDVVVAIRATVGKALAVPEYLDGANLTQGTAKVSAGSMLHGGYLLAALQSGPSAQHFKAVSKGATFREITLETLRRFPITLPPLAEQLDIVEYLTRKTARLDAMIRKNLTTIDLLKELRTALISAAVTGKIDVREEAA